MTVLQLIIQLLLNIIFKEYLPEILFTRIYLAEKCKYTTQYFFKKKKSNKMIINIFYIKSMN